MDFTDRDEMKNDKLLLVILGILVIPVVNSIDDLMMLLYQILGLSMKSLLISSVAFHGLIVGVLTMVLVHIVKGSKIESKLAKRLLTLRTLRIYGVSFFILVLGGLIANLYNKKYVEKLDLSKADLGGLEMADILYLTVAQTGLSVLSGVLVFGIYFVIVFTRTSGEMHYRQQRV